MEAGTAFPPLALVDRGIRVPALARHEHRRELRFARMAREEIARRRLDGGSDEGRDEQHPGK
jgi:hypothetical protein